MSYALGKKLIRSFKKPIFYTLTHVMHSILSIYVSWSAPSPPKIALH